MTTLGKYELHEEIGRGGFGTVYRATDVTLKRDVALKVLHPQLTVEADFLEKFRKEAQTVASLKSPHIVMIHELGESDGRIFIAMQYMDGGSLKDRLTREGALPFEKTLRIIQQVCAGLKVAHKRGLVHCDIKPANILFDASGYAVVCDFGLAMVVQEMSQTGSSSLGGLGTPAYKAPELWESQPPASPATDIYSLGCVLSEMLSGKVLFDGDTTGRIIAQHLHSGPHIPPQFPGPVPQGIHALLEKMLARQPGERYQDTDELISSAEELERPAQKTGQSGKTVQQSGTGALQSDSQAATKKEAYKPSSRLLWVLGALMVIGILVMAVNNQPFARQPDTSLDRTEPGQQYVTEVASASEIQSASQSDTYPTLSTFEQPQPGLGIGSEIISESDGMTLVYVPAGEFMMGSNDLEDDNQPAHRVYLDAFWIDQTEVTNQQYKTCVSAGFCDNPNQRASYTRENYYDNEEFANHPVIWVTWAHANDYCQWAGRRLPTEAEWEKAARGTDGWAYPWGNNFNGNRLNYCDKNCEFDWKDNSWNDGYADTSPVGVYIDGASPYGALDTLGNVWEWVADWYDESYYYHSEAENPKGPVFGEFRTARGGAWHSRILRVHTAFRIRISPSTSDDTLGFRCVMDASP